MNSTALAVPGSGVRLSVTWGIGLCALWARLAHRRKKRMSVTSDKQMFSQRKVAAEFCRFGVTADWGLGKLDVRPFASWLGATYSQVLHHLLVSSTILAACLEAAFWGRKIPSAATKCTAAYCPSAQSWCLTFHDHRWHTSVYLYCLI